jgi:2-(1,2-epoxy-1,2-dihydrophenyl)acetyl-CoA isomerase
MNIMPLLAPGVTASTLRLECANAVAGLVQPRRGGADMLTGELLYEREAGIAILTLRTEGKLNAFTTSMRDALTQRLRELNDDPDCRAVILTGADGNFSAGADMAGWGEKTVRDCRVRLKRGGTPLIREIVAGAKPVIAAVEGYAYGAGLALACACDYLVAADGAKFCCAFTRVGFIPDLGLMYTLPRRVGHTKAMQMIALADTVEAERALQLGLADEIVAKGGALERAKAMASRYAETPPLAFELVKGAMSRGLEIMLQAELDLQPMPWLSEDHEEGKRAFAQKRKPRFKGR